MTYTEIIQEVARKNGLSAKYVNKVYRAYWTAIKEYITSLPLKDIETEEEFLKLRPNINIPSIGKLYISIENFRGQKDRQRFIEYYKKKEEENATHQKD